MKNLLAAALIAASAWPARADLPPPPPPPEDRVAAANDGYFDGCFGVPRARAAPPVALYGDVPITAGSTSPGLPSLGSSSSDDKAWLIAAVVAAAALPVLVYAVDSEAPPIAMRRFECLTFSLDVLGGADRAPDGSGGFAVVQTRFSASAGHFLTDFEYDASRASSFAAHVVLRVTPKAHIGGGLALGYRRTVLDGYVQDGFEIGLPHEYTLWRDGPRTVGLEVRPMLLLGSGVQPMLEAAFLVPLGDVIHLRVGGRAYTFGGDLLWGLAAGLSLTL